MHGLERLIESILSVPISILFQRYNLRTLMLADSVINATIFINIVSQMQYQVQTFFCHMIVGGKIATLIMLTRSKRKPQPFGHHGCVWHGTSLSDSADCISGVKSIPVPAVRL